MEYFPLGLGLEAEDGPSKLSCEVITEGHKVCTFPVISVYVRV